METFELNIEHLKVRESIIKSLRNIEAVTILTKAKGELTLGSKDFDFKGRLSDFDNILKSIYQFIKKKDQWMFTLGNITVSFCLNS